MHILWFLFIGLFVGWLASVIVKGGGSGILLNIVIGIVGSMIGGFLSGALGVYPVTSLGALAMSVLGAVILLLIIRLIRRGA